MFRLEIDMSNDAFQGDAYDEVARILRVTAERLERLTQATGQCRDANGNVVGKWTVSPNASI